MEKSLGIGLLFLIVFFLGKALWWVISGFFLYVGDGVAWTISLLLIAGLCISSIIIYKGLIQMLSN